MNHSSPWDDPRVTAYVMGELSGDERVAFETEMASDVDLKAAVEEARGVTSKLESLFAAESTPSLDQGRRDAIVSGASSGSSTVGSQPASWKVPLLLLATAAVVALMIGIAPMLSDRGTTVSQVPPSQNGLVILDARVTDEEVTESGFDVPVVEERKLAMSHLKSTPVEVALSANKPMPTASTPIQLADDVSMTETRTAGRRGLNKSLAETPSQSSPLSIGKSDAMGDAEADDSIDGAKAESMGMMMMGEGLPTSGLREMEGLEYAGGARGTIETDYESKFLIPNKAKSVKESLARNRSRLEKSQLLESKPDVFSADLFVQPIDEGRGPGVGGDKFDPITDNAFKRVDEHPLSTFSVDVDTASYSKSRDFLMRANQLPRPDAVRIEELVNYFDYNYAPPANDAEHPFAAAVTITSCPWNTDHRLARIAIKGKTMQQNERPRCNLVFLIDTSGSMNAPNKLPLVVDGLKMLVKQLDDKDRVAIAVYAGSAGLVLDSTPAKKGQKIRKALTQLSSGGSTNGGAGIQLAYETARENFIKGGVNRVILCSDGDFNVGTTGTDELVRMVEREAKGGVFLSVLGFGMGNHNDAMLEQISGRGNGNYAFIDTDKEAHKVLVDQVAGTLVTIAKDVKLQVEFNPTKVSSYRLIGYENRILAKEDFNDDQKDAGEIGAGHAVTALYEIVPAGVEADASGPKVDDLKYQKKTQATEAADSNETLTLKLRYKQPDGDTSTLVEFPVTDDGGKFDAADVDTKFAAAVAGFGMQLRHSEYAGSWTIADVLRVAKSAKGDDAHELRSEFVELVEKAQELMGGQ